MNRNVVITGASMGIGRAIAEEFVRARDNVVLCARNDGPLKETARQLQSVAARSASVLWKTCDVSDEAQVTELAAFTLGKLGRCDVLINNAGVQGTIGPLDEVPWSEWKRTVEIDLFGVALCCRTFITQMKQRGRGKIINLSGGGATSSRPSFSAYAAAKTAVVRLTEVLADELRPFHIDVNAVAPGAMKTRLTAESLAAGPQKIGEQACADAMRTDQGGGVPAESAARLCAFLASAECNGITGRLISARFDDWHTLPRHRDELERSDIYTLRRIVPRDRGQDWGEPT
jgi:3-oxoacyl-[acyl-carrier protein] reductase